jgi:hypothetical protein
MLDVHPPHKRMEGFKDFFLHLLTITIGLLIALSLEGCVEWRHHKNLVREAEDGLHGEISRNEQAVASLKSQIVEQQKQLDADLRVLAKIRADPKAANETMGFGFQLQGFDEVAWKTAQSTGATAYMPYDDARTFSDIYGTQQHVFETEQQVVADVLHAAAIPSTQSKDWKPAPAQLDEIVDRIGLLKMRLSLLNSLVDSLNDAYGKYLHGNA